MATEAPPNLDWLLDRLKFDPRYQPSPNYPPTIEEARDRVVEVVRSHLSDLKRLSEGYAPCGPNRPPNDRTNPLAREVWLRLDEAHRDLAIHEERAHYEQRTLPDLPDGRYANRREWARRGVRRVWDQGASRLRRER